MEYIETFVFHTFQLCLILALCSSKVRLISATFFQSDLFSGYCLSNFAAIRCATALLMSENITMPIHPKSSCSWSWWCSLPSCPCSCLCSCLWSCPSCACSCPLCSCPLCAWSWPSCASPSPWWWWWCSPFNKNGSMAAISLIVSTFYNQDHQ